MICPWTRLSARLPCMLQPPLFAWSCVRSSHTPDPRHKNPAGLSLDQPFLHLLTRACTAYLPNAAGLRFMMNVSAHDVVSTCVVLFEAQRAAAVCIVLSSLGYCPSLMYMWLFMLLVSLSGRRQVHSMGPLCSHSRSPLTPAFQFLIQAKFCVCVWLTCSGGRKWVCFTVFTQGRKTHSFTLTTVSPRSVDIALLDCFLCAHTHTHVFMQQQQHC